jgi:hypothetical protein
MKRFKFYSIIFVVKLMNTSYLEKKRRKSKKKNVSLIVDRLKIAYNKKIPDV